MQMNKVIVKMNDGEIFEGGLVTMDSDLIVMRLPEGGTMEVRTGDCASAIQDGLITIDNKPVRTVEVNGEKVKKEKKEVVKGDRSTLKEGSKLKLVVDLCDANPKATRKQLISMILEAGIMTSEPGASTYHQNAKPYLLVNQKTGE